MAFLLKIYQCMIQICQQASEQANEIKNTLQPTVVSDYKLLLLAYFASLKKHLTKDNLMLFYHV